ncbi:hypothetical protein Taro_023969 [Colocasia esculenta]|uniref:Uncharacterized protein n=1 Tax=Colocasia esculenta TaxID=4460 RepID=A0A843V7Y8_COLES|nr:hypothetical protein [Colocasia esculenta]
METAERIKGKSVKIEQVSVTGRYQLTIGKKRPSGGLNEPADKKPKELGKQIVVATGERRARVQEERRTTGENRGSSSTSRCIDWAITSLTFIQRDRASCTMKYPEDREHLYRVVMRIQWTPMGQGKSEEHPSYEESTI